MNESATLEQTIDKAITSGQVGSRFVFRFKDTGFKPDDFTDEMRDAYLGAGWKSVEAVSDKDGAGLLFRS